MAKAFLMSWEGDPYYRWVKMYRGHRYRVSCAELGAPLTKEGSYQQANEWWKNKIAEAPPTPAEEEKLLWEDRLKTLSNGSPITMGMVRQGNTTPTQRSFEKQLEQFLGLAQKQLKPASYRELRIYLESVRDLLGKDFDCAAFASETVKHHHLWLVAKNYEPISHNKRLGFFRRFVDWLEQEEVLERAPKNLFSKLHRAKVVQKGIQEFSDVKETVEALPEKHRLWALLGLNCGMTNVDLGALTWQMIAPKTRILTRKRVKTSDNPNVPTVSYKLWDETWALLEKLKKSKETDLVFYTTYRHAPNQPLYQTKFDGKKEKKKDLFSTYWKRLDPRSPIPLGKFRSISATVLKSHEYYRGYQDYFLGHSAKSMGDKFYGKEADNPFFRALEYVRSEIFKK